MSLISRQFESSPQHRLHVGDRTPPSLRFTPTAWAKLLFLRDLGETEVGGFGISAADDLLLVEEFVLVPQVCSAMTVAFDDAAVADFFDQQVDLGRTPEQVGRVWIHTHPGDCAQPSGVDEETFERVFGRSDWAVMAILARGGQTYTRQRFRAGPGGSMTLPMEVDFQTPFAASHHAAWTQEYFACVQVRPELLVFGSVFDSADWDSLPELSPRRGRNSRSRRAPSCPRARHPATPQ